MGVFAGPKTETDSLVFALDARNVKTYDEIPGITDHGISDWYCFISGTATYSAIYSNTEIIEIDANGNEVGIVTTGSNPQRGTFSTTAGRRYYGTKAVHLLQTTAGDDQHELAPVSFAGTYFAHRWTRNSPTTYYAYAPQDDTTLEFFDNNAAGGVTGSVTATHTISRGFTTSFQSTAQETWQFFKADKPIIMTAGGTGWDKTILAPATQYKYKRRNDNSITINNTTPSNIGNNITYDTSLPVATVEIADGAGGDSTQGIGYEYLSDTFSWGDVLSDYQIVAPYADTTVTVSYWANSQWNIGEVHSLSGTQTSPDAVDRDGDSGFGVDGSIISGQAANLADGANLWKWESTKPIALIINDNADDEENILGWMSNNYERTSSNVTQSLINFINKNDKIFPKFYGKSLTTTTEYAASKLTPFNYFEFDGVDDYIIVQHKEWQNLDSWSVSMWINPNIIFDAESILFEKGGDLGYQLSLSTSGNLIFKDRGETNTISTTNDPVSILQWYNVVVTASPAGLQLYLNANLETSNTTAFGGNTSEDLFYVGGKQTISVLEKYFNGNIACFSFYSSVLTEQEILSNYNALRPRFIPTGSDPLQAISGYIMTENDNILLTENDEVLILP